ncbi:MAG: 50S ribosome-binding GTPase, partial [Gammaproteobacteria bacterium]|nr:50S ribosome-binding GTPase [Gammaproteobacteria bacterium]
GYTNAGKSTLFNALTGAAVVAEDKLFATLDPTHRRIALDGAPEAVLVDTVGFIRDLPHELVAAFHSTLEETREATLLLHVVDSGARERDELEARVNEVLAQIGADEVPQIVVMNKIDTLADEPPGSGEPRLERDNSGAVWRVWVSARDGSGLQLLLDAIGERLRVHFERRVLVLPPQAGRLRARLFEQAHVVDESLTDTGGWRLEVTVRPGVLERLCRAEGIEPDTLGPS